MTLTSPATMKPATVARTQPSDRLPATAAAATEPPTIDALARQRTRRTLRLAGTALTLLAVLTLGFVAHLAGISQLRYERSQQTAYADFRFELANATAPTGQLGPDGRLLPPGTPVALLRIPAIELDAVVLEGTDAGVLTAGPGHRRDTPLPGQPGTSVLMGRRAAYGGPFGRLPQLTTGDTVTVVTGQGEHTYRVIGVRYPGDPIPPAETASGRLTLITASGDPYLPEDLVRVDAELLTQVQPVPSRPLSAAALPPAEQGLATDPGAWFPLVLWGQALLLAALGVTWLRNRWGGWQAWIVGVPVLTSLGISCADQASRLLPNLL
jgi:sortase A